MVAHVNGIFNRSESISDMGRKIWELILSKMKQVSFLSV